MAEEEFTMLKTSSFTEVHGPNESPPLSDSEDELEEFNPNPYAFILKDAQRFVIQLPPERVSTAKIACPSFHILLDHVVAVLWCFYSRIGLGKLGTAQLHWALNFLEGVKSRTNKHTPDVSMAINHLEEAIVEVGSNLDEKTVSNREYDDEYKELSEAYMLLLKRTQRVTKIDSYDNFEASLLGKSIPKGTMFENEDGSDNISLQFQTAKVLTTTNTNKYLDTSFVNKRGQVISPSILLNNMFSDHGATLQQILNTAMQHCEEDEDMLSINKSVGGRDSDQSFNETYVTLRTDLIQRTIQQLEQIKTIDELLQSHKCDTNPEAFLNLKNTLGK